MQLLCMLAGALLLISVGAVNAAMWIGRMPKSRSVNVQPTTVATQWVSLMNDNGFTVSASDPHDRWVVFESEYGLSWDIFLSDQQTGQTQKLTDHFASDRFAVLSPDYTQVAFASWRSGNAEIYVLELTNGKLRNISSHSAVDILASWSPDGTTLAFVSERDGNAEIYLMDIVHGLLHNLTQNPAHDTSPQWSLDGESILFRSNRSGQMVDYQMAISEQHIVPLEES